MKNMIISILISSLLILPLMALTAKECMAGEESAAAAAFRNSYDLKDTLKIHQTKTSGTFALIWYSAVTPQGDTIKGTALMKNEGIWSLYSYAGWGATVDFLRGSGVPKAHWKNLIDAAWRKKTAPILKAFHQSKSAAYDLADLKIVDGWAYGSWSFINEGEVEAEGQALLKNKGGVWVLVESGGGAMGPGIMKEKGVPADVIKKLLDR